MIIMVLIHDSIVRSLAWNTAKSRGDRRERGDQQGNEIKEVKEVKEVKEGRSEGGKEDQVCLGVGWPSRALAG